MKHGRNLSKKESKLEKERKEARDQLGPRSNRQKVKFEKKTKNKYKEVNEEKFNKRKMKKMMDKERKSGMI